MAWLRTQVFTLITLLGCAAPWVTPRLFPVRSMSIRPAAVLIENQQAGMLPENELAPPPVDRAICTVNLPDSQIEQTSRRY
jgi:hypothetical protein